MDSDMLDHTMPKWCYMNVTGEKISVDQASEILIRTSTWSHYCANNIQWSKTLCEELGVPWVNYGPDYNNFLEVEKELGVLQLEYLHNSRIISSFIGGPFGWCNWDGTIGCDHFGIGKWATLKNIYDDWSTIAKKWPFLSLKTHVYTENEDSCEDEQNEDNTDNNIVIEFEVKNGEVTYKRLDGELLSSGINCNLFSMLGGLESEKGCTLEQFKHAVKLCKQQ